MGNPGDIAERIAILPPLREVIAAHGLSARKGLGQNFLLDLNLTGKIARIAGAIHDGTVIEVGPGPGGLTRGLLSEGAGRVVAIEKDPRCIEALAPLIEASGGRLDVITADALETDIEALGPAPRRIVANLPYNVATPLLIGWLKRAEAVDRLVLMFQREVAERIVAAPGTEAYGRLAVLTGWRAHARIAMTLPPRAFTPPPKVESAVVEIEPRHPPPGDCDIADLERVTAAAFGQRRKMLRGALKSLTKNPAGLLAAADIDPTTRAETLPIEAFVRLARAWRAEMGRG
ncbi:16S rRNA (adenine(1518)-N(6)/adenine(1519)-N(6))-dimethyltransferase RsmA [Marivibrio halodurans]|uniref:Ribosomal RNA small subunit methyltransferase A n=1 Tax=Marivibrio halodurans TaxID=2039722 RepID=A0A8J7S1Y8_9PROT|nr:16S rRNA (adenine(1518)-N(6)/adenine(1519)-N(6))-dimethyltransferase RsmA [Marivibrio halodurans]MBP5857098.1 16S rRNA (adenine(1518)-N(6)/adenine(1519)-N(6))-dimethyltransferase RsmA [Marivibrio halodurans]